jgi:hypothetical protein
MHSRDQWSRSLPGGADELSILGQNQDRPPFHLWAPLMSLPGILGHDAASFSRDIPYLAADPARIERWRSQLAPLTGRKIGIAWQGSKSNATDRRRSFSVTTLAPLGRLTDVSLVSLQKGEGSEQLAQLTEFRVHALGDDFDAGGGAFLDTAAVMRLLDLVVTADTSIAHLAGALGVPVWVALARVPDWRWGLTGESTPWYPSMRLFRQTHAGDWRGVFEAMTDALVVPERA